MMLKSSIGRLRLLSIVEGISYLLLLFIAMPLKYLADIPEAVSIVGAAHGALFVLYILAAVHVKFEHRKTILWGIYAFILSIIPFGTFYLDKQLKNEQ